ncbi:MAG TPA: anti-sigma factor [Acidobacteriaceae bacterium]
MMERHVNPEDPDLYALRALDGEEKQAFEAHVRACPACAAELDAARERVALMGLAAPVAAPAAGVKDALLRRVRAEGAGASGQASPLRAPARPRRMAWLTPVLAAATVAFASLAVWLWARNAAYLRQIDSLQAQLATVQTQSQEIARTAADTDKLLGMPGTVRVGLKPMTGMHDGRVGVLYNAQMGMVSCAGWLPAAPPKKSYQLWLVPMKGKPMSLRVFSGEWNEPMAMHVPAGMEAKAFAVTEEPLGGMPSPTGPMVMEGAGE